MSLEQRVEALETWQAQMDVVIRGTHDTVILILKEQRQLERRLCDIETKLVEHDDRFDRLEERIDKLEKKFDDRIDKLERLIVSALAEKIEGKEKKDLA